MTQPNEAMVIDMSNSLGMDIAAARDIDNWESRLEEASKWFPREQVQKWVSHRLCRIICLILNDTNFDGLDGLWNCVSSAISRHVITWESFAEGMKRHGREDALAEMHAHVLDQSTDPHPSRPRPSAKRL